MRWLVSPRLARETYLIIEKRSFQESVKVDRCLPYLDGLRASVDRCNSPLRQFGTVILHLCADNSTSLSVKPRTPIKSITSALSLRIKLIEVVSVSGGSLLFALLPSASGRTYASPACDLFDCTR
jgi:hypothetical protein